MYTFVKRQTHETGLKSGYFCQQAEPWNRAKVCISLSTGRTAKQGQSLHISVNSSNHETGLKSAYLCQQAEPWNRAKVCISLSTGRTMKQSAYLCQQADHGTGLMSIYLCQQAERGNRAKVYGLWMPALKAWLAVPGHGWHATQFLG